jgi:hypothetical protein
MGVSLADLWGRASALLLPSGSLLSPYLGATLHALLCPGAGWC